MYYGKIRRVFLISLPMVLAACLCSGCLVTGSKTKYLRKNEEVKSIHFESEEAGLLFHKQRKTGMCRTHHAGCETLVIPFICAYNKNTKLASNARYNDEIDKCDSNRDGIISLTEARIYSGYSKKPKKKHSKSSPCSR